jgi:hypothetical protein
MRVVPAPVADSHERINVSSPNTKIGLYYFLIRSLTLVARSEAVFWVPSDAGVCLQAKNQVIEFSCPLGWRIIQQQPPVCHCVTQSLAIRDLQLFLRDLILKKVGVPTGV